MDSRECVITILVLLLIPIAIMIIRDIDRLCNLMAAEKSIITNHPSNEVDIRSLMAEVKEYEDNVRDCKSSLRERKESMENIAVEIRNLGTQVEEYENELREVRRTVGLFAPDIGSFGVQLEGYRDSLRECQQTIEFIFKSLGEDAGNEKRAEKDS